MNATNARTRLSLPAVRMVVLLTLCATGARPQVNHEPAARAFLAELVEGKFEAAVTRFDDTMLKAMPAPKLAETWGTVVRQVGAYQEVTGARQIEVGGYQAVLLTTRFAAMSLNVRVVFDNQSRIAGLFFTPAPAERPWSAPDYATPAAFIERGVTVGRAPWELPGVLSVPKGSGKFPAVVLVHGSGSHDADETIGPNKPLKDLAWGLASRGVAVLRYEKRGHKYPRELAAVKNATVFEETVEDAQLAVGLLAAQPEVDPARIYVAGHSLGAMLAPRIAAGASRVAGIVLLAGNSRPLEILMREQVKYLTGQDGKITEAEQKQIDALESALQQASRPDLKPDDTVALLGAAVPGNYFLDLRGYQPASTAAKLGLPTLVLWGERDYQVVRADFDGWKSALRGQKNAAFKSYPALNHLFLAGSGASAPAEYMRPGHVAAEVVEDLALWILERKLKQWKESEQERE